MKKLIFGIIFVLLLVNVISQDEAQDDANVNLEFNEDVGIAPDSAFYGLENAFKKISLALTFSKEAKTRKELKIAKERLREIRLMIEENKLDAAEKAKIRHEEISQKLKARFENKVDADDDEIELQAEIENEIDEQEAEIEDIKTRIEIKGELSEEQRAKLMEFVENLKSSGNEVRLKIDSRKDRLKIKLKEKGLTEIEIEERIESEKETGLDNALTNRIEHVKREIEKSREHLDQNKNNLDNDKLAESRSQLDTADETLSEAVKKVEEKKYDEARELINKALRLAVLIRGNEKRFEANREILKDDLKREVGEERLKRAMEKLREKEERLEIKREKLEARKIAEDSEDEDDFEEIDEDEIEDESDDEIDEEDYFIGKMDNEMINKRGMPIEGFTPSMFLGVFPKLEKKDFHNVKAVGGVYHYTENKLNFEMSSDRFSDDGGVMVSSADGTIGEEGMEKLLENLSQRLNIKIDGKESIDLIIDRLK